MKKKIQTQNGRKYMFLLVVFILLYDAHILYEMLYNRVEYSSLLLIIELLI